MAAEREPSPETLWEIVRDVDEWMTPGDFIRSLRERGLHLVTDADKKLLDVLSDAREACLEGKGLHVVTDADLRVLEAMTRVGLTRNRDGARFKSRAQEKAVCEAELARRGEKP